LTSTSSPTVGSARADSRSNNANQSLNLNGTEQSSAYDSNLYFNMNGRSVDDDMFSKAYSGGHFMDSGAFSFNDDVPNAPPLELSFLSPSLRGGVSTGGGLGGLSAIASPLKRYDEDEDDDMDNKMISNTSSHSGQSPPLIDTPGKLGRSKSTSRFPVVSAGGPSSPTENSKFLFISNRKSIDLATMLGQASIVRGRTASDESSCNSILDYVNNEVCDLSNHSSPGMSSKKNFVKPNLLKSSSCPVVSSRNRPVSWDVSSSPQLTSPPKDRKVFSLSRDNSSSTIISRENSFHLDMNSDNGNDGCYDEAILAIEQSISMDSHETM